MEEEWCETAGINDTVQFRDMCKLLHNRPLSLSNPSTLNISNKVMTVLDFFAAQTLKKMPDFWICNWDSCYFWRLFFVHCFLVWSASPMTGRQETSEGQGNHPHLFTLVTTGKQTATWFPTENQPCLWEQLLEKLFFKHKATADMIGQIPLFPSFLKKNKATMKLHTFLCPSNRNAVVHLHIWWAVFHYWK